MNKQSSDPFLPIVGINIQRGENNCRQLEQCEWYERQMREKLIGRYIGVRQPFDGQIIAACLNLRGLTYEDYILRIKKQYKGAALRHANKADREGYTCKPFVKELFIPDIVEINHSKNVRSGGPMRESYLRSVEGMGGIAIKYIEMKLPDCPVHYDYWWGIFSKIPGYKQGGLVTNEKLLAYIRLRRNGNYSLYAQILGHGDYLKYGIMYRLHFSIIEWICHGGNGCALGLEYLIYAGYRQGKEGLKQWKKKILFKPVHLVIPDSIDN